MKERARRQRLYDIVMLVIALSAIYFQIFQPTTQADRNRSLILFLFILGYVGLVYFIAWIRDNVRSYTDRIVQNESDIGEIKELLNTERRFHDIDKRLALLEKQRRGNA